MNDRLIGDVSVAENPVFDNEPAIKFDIEKYAAEIDDYDLTEEEAAQFLGAMWSIMCTFVHLGVRIDACASFANSAALIPKGESAEVESDDHNKDAGCGREG